MTLAEVLGWAANVIAAVLDVFAFPATAMFWIASLLGRVERDPLAVFLYATLEIGVLWAVAAFTVGGLMRWIARFLEIWIVPAVIRSARVDAARKVVAPVFFTCKFLEQVSWWFSRSGYSVDKRSGKFDAGIRGRRAARRQQLGRLLLRLPTVPFSLVRVVLSLVRSWFVLLMLAAAAWVAFRPLDTFWAPIPGMIEVTYGYLNDQQFTTVLAVLVLVLAYVATPGIRAQAAWRASRLGSAHGHLDRIALAAGRAYTPLTRAIDELDDYLRRKTLPYLAKTITAGEGRWNSEENCVHLVKPSRYYALPMMLRQESQWKISLEYPSYLANLRQALDSLDKIFHEVRKEGHFWEVSKITPLFTRSTLFEVGYWSGGRCALWEQYWLLDPENFQKRIEDELRHHQWITDKYVNDDFQENADEVQALNARATKVVAKIYEDVRDGLLNLLWKEAELIRLSGAARRYRRPGTVKRVLTILVDK